MFAPGWIKCAQDMQEQIGLDGREIGHRVVAVIRLGELLITVAIQLFGSLSDLFDPGLKLFGGNRMGLEMHIGVPQTAYLVVMTGIRARLISQEVQLGLHTTHGVHLAAQLRNEKGSHDGCRGEFKTERHLGRKSELVDRGDIVIRVDEEPLPVQGDGLNGNGLVRRGDGLIGIQRMGPGPGQIRQKDDDENGHRPHDQIDSAGITPFRHVRRSGIGSPVFAGEPESHDKDGDDDDGHEPDGRENEEFLRFPDGSFGIKQEYRAAP